MIFYGTNAVRIESKPIPNVPCPNCEQEDHLTMHVYRKHAHIWWIPLFPIGKTGHIECGHCHYVMEENQMADGIKESFVAVKKSTRGPIWQFAGLAVIALLIGWVMVSNSQDKEEYLTYLNAPEVGDKYDCKFGDGYSCLLVDSVSADSVYVLENMYETNKRRGIKDIDKESNYVAFHYGVSRGDLLKRLEDGDIFKVRR